MVGYPHYGHATVTPVGTSCPGSQFLAFSVHHLVIFSPSSLHSAFWHYESQSVGKKPLGHQVTVSLPFLYFHLVIYLFDSGSGDETQAFIHVR